MLNPCMIPQCAGITIGMARERDATAQRRRHDAALASALLIGGDDASVSSTIEWSWSEKPRHKRYCDESSRMHTKTSRKPAALRTQSVRIYDRFGRFG